MVAATIRREMKHCRYCGFTRNFAVQFNTAGVAELVTETVCPVARTDADGRAVLGATCEPSRIQLGRQQHGKFARAKRRR